MLYKEWLHLICLPKCWKATNSHHYDEGQKDVQLLPQKWSPVPLVCSGLWVSGEKVSLPVQVLLYVPPRLTEQHIHHPVIE